MLSQLITVEDAHSTAIEVALGAAMQNIVTDNEADAKRAMQYLKQNNAGRATFLPISNIQGRRLEERGLEDCFGYVALAPELVDCDRRYSQIISNLLGRTVIVEDLDSAIGMAKQYHNRFRIVTLDGQVMNGRLHERWFPCQGRRGAVPCQSDRSAAQRGQGPGGADA